MIAFDGALYLSAKIVLTVTTPLDAGKRDVNPYRVTVLVLTGL
jgi:hypothetical protein